MNAPRPDIEPFRLLFVCTGNTCRSPMAEALARRGLARREWTHVEVGSAGVAAGAGEPASEGALRAAAARGLDLSSHRSRPLDAAMIEEADLILAMSPGHVQALLDAGAADRSALLTAFAAGVDDRDAPPVADPFGGPDEVYEQTLSELEELVEQALLRLEPVLSP